MRVSNTYEDCILMLHISSRLAQIGSSDKIVLEMQEISRFSYANESKFKNYSVDEFIKQFEKHMTKEEIRKLKHIENK